MAKNASQGQVDENETAAVPLGVGTTAVFLSLYKRAIRELFQMVMPESSEAVTHESSL